MSAEAPARILIVDDEAVARISLAEVLRLEGYHVKAAASGEEALEIVEEAGPFDLMIVDLKMPGMDGIQLTEAIQRRSPDTVIILLTAFATLETAIEAIRRGAHDYLLKPCPVQQVLESVRKGLDKSRLERRRRELMSRLEETVSELLATGASPGYPPTSVGSGSVLRVQDVELDPDRYTVTVGGRPVDLTPTEFRLLACLMENAGQVCTPQELVRRAQGYDTDPWGARAIVRVHVRRLRQKLEPDPSKPRYVVNVRGVGYLFPADPQRGEPTD